MGKDKDPKGPEANPPDKIEIDPAEETLLDSGPPIDDDDFLFEPVDVSGLKDPAAEPNAFSPSVLALRYPYLWVETDIYDLAWLEYADPLRRQIDFSINEMSKNRGYSNSWKLADARKILTKIHIARDYLSLLGQCSQGRPDWLEFIKTVDDIQALRGTNVFIGYVRPPLHKDSNNKKEERMKTDKPVKDLTSVQKNQEERARLMKELGPDRDKRVEEVLEKLPLDSPAFLAIYSNSKRCSKAGRGSGDFEKFSAQLGYQVDVAQRLCEADPAPVDRDSIQRCQQELAKLYGLDRAKKNLLSILAGRIFKPTAPSTPLLLVGPPGVGKTCLAKAAAAGLGRAEVCVCLGGTVDNQYLRGSSSIWIGSAPGQIANAFQAHGRKFLLILDELDKLPATACGNNMVSQMDILQIVDTTQNQNYRDFYLDYGLDLSTIPIIATANSSEPLIEPLKNRFEIINIPDYSIEEKFIIADQFLIPSILKEMGLDDKLSIVPALLDQILQDHKNDIGMRPMERTIRLLLSAVAYQIVVENRKTPGNLTVFDYHLVAQKRAHRKFNQQGGGFKR